MVMANPFEGKEVWFGVGSQDLYGEEALRQVAEQRSHDLIVPRQRLAAAHHRQRGLQHPKPPQAAAAWPLRPAGRSARNGGRSWN